MSDFIFLTFSTTVSMNKDLLPLLKRLSLACYASELTYLYIR